MPLSNRILLLLGIIFCASLGAMHLTEKQEQKWRKWLEESWAYHQENIKKSKKEETYLKSFVIDQHGTSIENNFNEVYKLVGGKGTIDFHAACAVGGHKDGSAVGEFEIAGTRHRIIYYGYEAIGPEMDERALDSRARKALATAIILHEMGHIFREHSHKRKLRRFSADKFYGWLRNPQHRIEEYEADLFSLFIIASSSEVRQLLHLSFEDVAEALTLAFGNKKHPCTPSDSEIRENLEINIYERNAILQKNGQPVAQDLPLPIGYDFDLVDGKWTIRKLPTNNRLMLFLEGETQSFWNTSAHCNLDVVFQDEQMRANLRRLRNNEVKDHPTAQERIQAIEWFKKEFANELENENLWEKITFNDVCTRFRKHLKQEQRNEIIRRRIVQLKDQRPLVYIKASAAARVLATDKLGLE